MSVLTQLMLILLGLAVLFVIAIGQIVGLARIYRSWSWWAGAATLIILGARQMFGFIRLPSAILELQIKGVVIEQLNFEQWLMTVWAFLIAIGFVVWLWWLRRDLRRFAS